MESRDERRSKERYPVNLNLEYTLRHRDRVALTGRGRTLNLSTHGLLFESESALPTGMWIELSIQWPVLLHGEVRLKLHAKGRIVRVNGKRIAVTLRQYDFRTTALPNTVP